MEEMDVLFPGKEITIKGQAVRVRPFTFGQLPKAIKLLSKVATPLIQAQQAGTNIDATTLLSLLADGGEELNELLASGTGLSTQVIEQLDLDEGIELLSVFIEVNGSFFTQKVLPKLKEVAAKHLPGQK